MKRLLLFSSLVIFGSTFIFAIPIVQARGTCEQTGIVIGTITFVDLVCDTILYVPRFVFRTLTGPGQAYRSRHDRHYYTQDSFHFRDSNHKKKRRGGRKKEEDRKSENRIQRLVSLISILSPERIDGKRVICNT